MPTDYGNLYVKVGGFLDGPKEAAGQIGFRYPYYLTGTDKNGYYFGGFVGHVETKSIDGKKYNRLGAGGELSYVWMDNSRVSAASIGIGFGEQKVVTVLKNLQPQWSCLAIALILVFINTEPSIFQQMSLDNI